MSMGQEVTNTSNEVSDHVLRIQPTGLSVLYRECIYGDDDDSSSSSSSNNNNICQTFITSSAHTPVAIETAGT